MAHPDYPYYEERLAQHSAIWADLYAVTMAQALHTMGKHEQNVTFHGYIRKNPFDGAYLLTAGQNIFTEWYENYWQFDDRDAQILLEATVPDLRTGEPRKLFTPAFVDMLMDSKPELTVRMMPEGEIAFPDEPIAQIHGPAWQGLMVEKAFLNMINSQSLFATLASRLKEVADGAPILAFGGRRAQCVGGLESARGSYIGGADATSNTLAHKYYGIPWTGTFAHAWVMLHEDELEAFKNYAQAMPHNGVFLVDTYDTVEGVKKAIKACKETGVKMKGIRLDSGDLAYLSKAAREILDAEGFTDAVVAATNDLDEEKIQSLKYQGARIDVWGVGTNLETSKAQPALGAVYKLGATFDSSLSQNDIEAARRMIAEGHAPTDENFVREVIKLSEQEAKVSIPGEMDVLRYVKHDENGKAERFDGDTIMPNMALQSVHEGANKGWDFPDVLARDIESVPKGNEQKAKTFTAGTSVYKPLRTIFNKGVRVAPAETIHEARARAAHRLSLMDESHKRLLNPHEYVTGIERSLLERRKQMILNIRKGNAPK